MRIADVWQQEEALGRYLKDVSKDHQPWYKTELQPAFFATRALEEKVPAPEITDHVKTLAKAKQMLGALKGRLEKADHGTEHDKDLLKYFADKNLPVLILYLDQRAAELTTYQKTSNAKMNNVLNAGVLMKNEPNQDHLNTVVGLIGDWSKFSETVEGVEPGAPTQEWLRKIRVDCEKLWKARQDAQHSMNNKESPTEPLCNKLRQLANVARTAKV